MKQCLCSFAVDCRMFCYINNNLSFDTSCTYSHSVSIWREGKLLITVSFPRIISRFHIPSSFNSRIREIFSSITQEQVISANNILRKEKAKFQALVWTGCERDNIFYSFSTIFRYWIKGKMLRNWRSIPPCLHCMSIQLISSATCNKVFSVVFQVKWNTRHVSYLIIYYLIHILL